MNALQPEWISLGDAFEALLRTGADPDIIAAVLFLGLQQGTILGRATRVVTEYAGDPPTEHRRHPVPPQVWQAARVPPLGHPFWTSGGVTIDTNVEADGHPLDLRPQFPVVHIVGLEVPRLALLALGGTTRSVRRRGRAKGVGGYEKADEPLVSEMHRLLEDSEVSSIHAAAVSVSGQAKGHSSHESKVRRLMKHYRSTFEETP